MKHVHATMKHAHATMKHAHATMKHAHATMKHAHATVACFVVIMLCDHASHKTFQGCNNRLLLETTTTIFSWCAHCISPSPSPRSWAGRLRAWISSSRSRSLQARSRASESSSPGLARRHCDANKAASKGGLPRGFPADHTTTRFICIHVQTILGVDDQNA
jgi:hypothetical protein